MFELGYTWSTKTRINANRKVTTAEFTVERMDGNIPSLIRYRLSGLEKAFLTTDVPTDPTSTHAYLIVELAPDVIVRYWVQGFTDMNVTSLVRLINAWYADYHGDRPITGVVSASTVITVSDGLRGVSLKAAGRTVAHMRGTEPNSVQMGSYYRFPFNYRTTGPIQKSIAEDIALFDKLGLRNAGRVELKGLVHQPMRQAH